MIPSYRPCVASGVALDPEKLDTEKRGPKVALVTVHDEGSADVRSKNRWSASKEPDVVERLLRGEELEEVSREVGIEAHRLDQDPTFEMIWVRHSKRTLNRGQCREPVKGDRGGRLVGERQGTFTPERYVRVAMI